MKNGKTLTLAEKKALTRGGLNPKDWLRVKKEFNGIQIVNVNDGRTIWFRY
ncbi:MAG: DUF6906 family protein [Filifactoraceae bacterium]